MAVAAGADAEAAAGAAPAGSALRENTQRTRFTSQSEKFEADVTLSESFLVLASRTHSVLPVLMESHF